MSTLKMYQHNADFNRLVDEKLNLLENAYRNAKDSKEKDEVLRTHGFDLDDFYKQTIKKTNDRMVKLGVSAHAQRTADYLGKKRRTIYRYL